MTDGSPRHDPLPAPGGAAHRWLVLVIVSLGMFVVELDTTVVNIALPSIQHSLRFPDASLQWVINAYLLCFGGFLLLAGRMSDRFGGKRLFLAGMLAFGLGSAMNVVAPSAAVLIGGRALQGLGGAALMPTTLSTINTTFTDPAGRRKALGVWTAIQTGSVALGLLIGGVVTSELSWRWIFTINVPVAAVAILGASRYVPGPRVPGLRRGFDLAGAVTITAGLSLAIYALSRAPSRGWSAGSTIGPMAAATLLVGAFIVIEWRGRSPMVPLGIFRIRPLAAGNVGFLFTSAGMYGMFFFSSLYVQDVLGYSPIRSGVALLPLTVGVLIGAGASQPLIKVAKTRIVALTGLVVGVAGALLLTRVTADGAYATGFLPGLFVIAAGLGLSMVPFTMMATSGVPDHEAGLASGLYTATSYTGGAVGLAVLSTIAAATTTAHALGGSPATRSAARLAMVTGYHAAFFTAAVMLGIAALVTAVWLRRRDVAAITAPAGTS